MSLKKMYIDGQWCFAETQKTKAVINPATGEKIAEITNGDANDVKRAAQAAKRAFLSDGEWSNMNYEDRAALLIQVAESIEEKIDDFAEAETLCQGMPFADAKAEMNVVAGNFRYFASIAGTNMGVSINTGMESHTMTIMEPIGVCGIIVPWNFPLTIASAHIAAALSAGNTVVFKPSSITPLSAVLLFDVMDEVGFPKGVINLILGDSESAGTEIASNENIGKITFVGGTETGRKIMQGASNNLKRVCLELGGKSAFIVFDDCNFEAAVDNAMMAMFVNAGQICVAGSRLLVQEGIYDKFVKEIVRRTVSIKVGNGMDSDSLIGPITTKSQMENILDYIQKGVKEGATLACGGYRLTDSGLGKGYFIAPTVFTGVKNHMTIAQEEIFGPVLVVEKFKDEKEAIEIANDSKYGLAGGVFTSDLGCGLRVAKSVRTGVMWVNCYFSGASHCASGGIKQSGMGVEGGMEGLKEYSVQKHITISLNPQPAGFTE